jgi:tripeptide aminopeptidase
MSSVIDRFLRYVKIDTTSDHNSETNPSTPNQFDLANLLVEECKALGLVNVTLTEKCHVLAELPANTDKEIPVIGFNAHMDTSPDYSGTNINPRIIEYTGGDVIENEETGITLSPEQFPFLKDMLGQHLIIPDGTTLLGADDKAGIAEIMSAVEYLIAHPEIEHGTVKICFTPDEEIGQGVEYFEYRTIWSGLCLYHRRWTDWFGNLRKLQCRQRKTHNHRPQHPPRHSQRPDAQRSACGNGIGCHAACRTKA